jgi:RNA polymerase sigma factor (sigma-70 family)
MDPAGESGLTDLVERARAGEAAAWDALTARFTNLLWSIARGMRLDEADAADAVQTTWLRLVERLDAVRDPEHLASWLATTVRRECLSLLRRGRRAVPVGDDDLLVPAQGGAPTPEEALLTAERDAVLWRAFERLTARCRSLLRILMADPPPSYAAVAAALDMQVGSIGPTRRRCLEQLRGHIRTAGFAGGAPVATDPHPLRGV